MSAIEFTQLISLQANPHYISVNWEASGGGAFAVIPINERGRLPDQLPLFRGHTAVVLDIDWYVRYVCAVLKALIGCWCAGTLSMTR